MDFRVGLSLLVVAAALVPGAAAAHAADPSAPSPSPPASLAEKPGEYVIGAHEALRIANGTDEVAEQSERYGRLVPSVAVEDNGRWAVGYRKGPGGEGPEAAKVIVDGFSGEIHEAWTGHQVAWPMARGYEGQFGHVLNSPWVWLPLSVAFLALLFDWRRPLRIVHVDLLVLLAFGVSHVFFNRGEIGLSAPLVYPVLAYLLVRALWLGLRGGEGLRPSAPLAVLVIAAAFLLCFRVTLNVADSGVIDVGYAGAIGADRIVDGEPIYGDGAFPDENRFGDTYGPANYYAYVPFELVFPWSGEWDRLEASHAAAIAFDLAALAGLVAFGLRFRPGRRGRALAAALAVGWLAYPYTAFALQSNSNDSLVAALVIWSLVLFARPVGRGVLLALAAMVKFAPLALAPLYLGGERTPLARAGADAGGARPLRSALAFAAAFALACALILAHPAIDPGLATFWERTVENQLDRSSPFSVWGQVEGVRWLQAAVLAATAAFAATLALLPRARPLPRVAALAAAVLIALQLGVDHWFYLYIPWFLGPLLIALAATEPLQEPPASSISAAPGPRAR